MRINRNSGDHKIQPMGDGDGKKSVHARSSKIGLNALAAGRRTNETASSSMKAGGHTASTKPHGKTMNLFRRSA